MNKKTQKSPARGKWLRRGILVMLLLSAGVLIWMRQVPPSRLETVETPSPTHREPRQERSIREAAYERDLSALEKLLESGAADVQTQAQAAQRLERMTQEHQCEIAIEEALMQAGYLPVLVLYQNGALTVMVEEELSAEAGAAVLSLCIAHADVAAENVRIMTVQP